MIKHIPFFLIFLPFIGLSQGVQVINDSRQISAKTGNMAAKTAANTIQDQNYSKVRDAEVNIGVSYGAVALSIQLDVDSKVNPNDFTLNTKQILEAGIISTQIIDYVGKSVHLAESNPLFEVCALNQSTQFLAKVVKLNSDIQNLVLSKDPGYLASSGKRDLILQKIIDDLIMLRTTSYLVYRKMYYAKRNGVWTTLNPLADYIRKDKLLISNIKTKYKML